MPENQNSTRTTESSAFYFKPRLGLTIFVGFWTVIAAYLFFVENMIGSGEFNIPSFLLMSVAGASLILFSKTLSKKPALTISNDGLEDNTVLGAGSYKASWKEIERFEVKDSILLIYYHEPSELIEKQSDMMKKDLKAKLKKYGTPTVIKYAVFKDPSRISEVLEERIGKGESE